MSTEDSQDQAINRRSLLAGTAVAAATSSVGTAEAASPRANWDDEYDIVIVGFGIASCSAAIPI